MNRLEKEQPLTRIEIDSEFDPSSHMRCCSKSTTQKQIDYRLTLNKQTFIIPNVWASVCPECDNVYFAPEVGKAVDERIFEIQHPKESKFGRLLESPEKEQHWVTVAEASEIVGYSQSYIRDLISRDRIPSKKLRVEVTVKRPISKRFVDLEVLQEHKRTAKRGRPPKKSTPHN